MASTQQKGNEGERLAVSHLEALGYQIRDRNVPCRVGELDIVAFKDGVLCIVEVRMRSTAAWGDPSLTVMSSKRHKVAKAALYYLQRERLLGRVMVRFDVISIVGQGPRARVEHIPDAFDAGF